METKHFCLFITVSIIQILIVVNSSPVSEIKTSNVKSGDNIRNKSRSTTTVSKIKNSTVKLRDSESEDGAAEPETVAEAEPPSNGAKGPKRGLPYFPSFNKPFDEFQADLDKIMEHINAGLEKVIEGFHELVHDPGLSHDNFYITGFDKDLFKNMIAKWDEAQAAKRRLVEERKANATQAKNMIH